MSRQVTMTGDGIYLGDDLRALRKPYYLGRSDLTNTKGGTITGIPPQATKLYISVFDMHFINAFSTTQFYCKFDFSGSTIYNRPAAYGSAQTWNGFSDYFFSGDTHGIQLIANQYLTNWPTLADPAGQYIWWGGTIEAVKMNDTTWIFSSMLTQTNPLATTPRVITSNGRYQNFSSPLDSVSIYVNDNDASTLTGWFTVCWE